MGFFIYPPFQKARNLPITRTFQAAQAAREKQKPMAKRYTDSDKWKKSWFRRLTPLEKCFWSYVLDNCNHAGIWEVDFELASYCIGEELNAIDIMKAFRKQYVPFSTGKRWFIMDFIDFQYGELNTEVRAHASVISILKRAGLWEAFQLRNLAEKDIKNLEAAPDLSKIDADLSKIVVNPSIDKPLVDTLQSVKDKDKDMDKDQDKDPDLNLESEEAIDVPAESIRATKLTLLKAEFDIARKRYPGTRRGLEVEWGNLAGKFKPADVVPLLLPAIERGLAYREGCASVNAFAPDWPMFATWINQSRFTEEYGAIPAPKATPFNAPPPTREQLEKNMQQAFGLMKGIAP